MPGRAGVARRGDAAPVVAVAYVAKPCRTSAKLIENTSSGSTRDPVAMCARLALARW